MTASRRLAPLPLALTALLALLALALGGVLLWSTPADAQTASRILVSNVSQSGNERVDLDGNDHAQLFHTGTPAGGWVLTSLIVVSEDNQGDDFDVDICEAHNSTEFPTSTCTRLSRPSSFAAGSLKFTAPGTGIDLNSNDNYVAVFKQAGNEDVSLDATTSAGEDSTGLSGWNIKNRFDWKDGNTWKHKGGSSNEAILITVNGYDTRAQQEATGRPVILASAEGAPYLFADTSGIADGNGLPFSGSEASVIEFTYSYQWIRVDGGTETNVGADSPRYRLVDADIGKQIKVEVSFTDVHNFSETVTSRQFGPVLRPASLPSPSTLVSNTGQSASATATITKQYAMEFTLGDHGQGYELSSVSINLAAAPTDLTVSLWIGDHSVTSSAPRIKLFDFENPASFQVGLNRFTAPAGVLAYQSVRYYIVLTGFGSSLSIKETTSDDEDAVGEEGAELKDLACERALDKTGHWEGSCSRGSVLRLAVEGSRRDSGILVSTFAQPTGTDQETISVGDDCCFRMGVGAADRYLIRGFSWRSDDTTSRSGGITNPWDLVEGSSSSGAKLFRLINTRNAAGITEWTAPQGATVKGGSSKTYTFAWDEDFPYGFSFDTRTGATLTQIYTPASGGGYDRPSAGVTVTDHGDINTPYAPLLAILGEPLYALVQNLGQADNAYHSVGGASSKVVTQGFTTGSREGGYGLLGIGVDIQGSAARVPDGPTSVSVAVHADSGGKPGAKLFDLVSPTEFAPGHSFFEAPRGTTLEPSTSYVMVWTYNGGTWHRLHRTSSNSEDTGKLRGSGIADAYYRGANVSSLSVDSGGHSLQIAVYTNENATGRPVILSPVDEAGILYAHTFDIADADGIPFSGASDTFNVFNKYTYRWVRVDGGTETDIGADSPRYRIVDADTGKLIKVEVSFDDHAGNAESVTSRPFGPITEPAPLPSPTTLVGNTGQPASATATADITEEYAMEFTLGDHGQGYEIASVSIDLAAAPSDLTASLWMGKHSGSGQRGSRVKLFDFENPSSFQTRLNEFTAPAGAFAYQGVEYFIVLSDFGASLSINETSSNNEDASGEPGAELANSAGGDTNVLRLAVKGSRRDRGILVSNFAQPGEGDQEIISIGDKCCFKMDVGNADRYLVRGFSWSADDTTSRQGGFRNPFELHEGSSTGVKDGDDTRRLTMYNTRNNEGVAALTAPLGATVAGGSKTYTFLLDLDLGRDGEGNKIERIDAVLTRTIAPAADGEDSPGAAGFDLSTFGDAAYPDAPYVTVFGEPLYAMTSNLGQSDNGYASIGGTNAKVLSQGFSTGPNEDGYQLLGIGVDIEGSAADGNPQVPDGPTFVSVAVHAHSGGKPGAKLFDLISPTEFAPGHNFFEAPRGTTLDANTNYVMVWRYNAGTWHRLHRTTSDGEDSGSLTGFSIANTFYFGSNLNSLNTPSGNQALEIAVYGVERDQPLSMPTASFERATYSVTESGSVTVKVQLSVDPGLTVAIPLTTTNQGGATSADYSGVPASVTFQSGDTEKSFIFTAADDTVDDDDERVKLGFGTLPSNITAGTTSETTISIRDNDDPAVTVGFELVNYSVAEGDTVDVKVKLNANPERTVTIPLTTTNEAGASSSDYSGVPSSVTFQSGDTEKSFTFMAALDSVQDDAERVKLGFGLLPARVTAGARDEATVSITDNDDSAITVGFERASYTVAEGGTVTVKVQLNVNPQRIVTIPLTRIHRGGASFSDYTGVPASVTFQSGDTEKSFTFTAIQDTVDDDDESVRLGFSTLPAKVTAGTTPRATVSIADDDDPAVTVRFELADYSVAEGDTVRVKVKLNVAPERTVTIPLTTTNEAGASSSDYSGVPSSVTFQGGDTEKSFTFTAALDSVQDDAERVKLGFGALPARVTAGTRDEATVLITDDDAPAITVGFELANYSVAEGDNVAVRVKLNKNPERTVTIPLTTINQGGATSGDYSGLPSSVRFQSGETVRSFTFTAARDAVEDDGESVKLGFGTLPAKVTSGATDEATVSITDVEPVVSQPPTVSATAEPNTVYPGASVILRGMGSDPDGDPLTYRWTSDGGGIFVPSAVLRQTNWSAPATETARTVNLTLTATDPGGLSASVTVSVVVEPFPQPNAATGLSGEVGDDNSVSLTWTIPSQPRGVTIESVLVQQRDNRGAFEASTWDTVVTLTGPATFSGVPALAADRDFFFRIRLTTTHGLTADSRPLNVRTRTEETPAPQHFAAVWPTQTSIALDWFTVETAAEYKLEFRKDGETEWTRISGDFDHLPSTSDHRDAFGVAAGLDCETDYDFRLSARGNGETRNDGRRYPSGSFGATATTSAQTGECAEENRITNLLVSVEPGCAILTWTPPSGDRDTGYRVERYSYTGSHRSEPETLVEQADRVAARYEDCSAEYRTDGAEHVYSVTALDNNPEPDEEGAFGTAYTSLLVFGPSREPEGPRNVRLTHDAQSSRGLAWDAPRDPWLTTVKTARAGSGPQQVVTDPWTTGYRVERREYRRTEGGGWAMPEVDDETLWSATMTVGASTTGTPATGYFGLGSNTYGALTQTTFTHPVGSGSWEVVGLAVSSATGLSLVIQEGLPITENLSHDAFEHWVLVVDGRSFPLELPEGVVGAGALHPDPWPNHGLSWTDGQMVSVQLVERERFEWDTVRDETDGDTGTSFTDSEDKGDKQYVYRVWAYNDRGLSLYSWRGDWAFNGGDPGGDPEPAEYIPPPPAQQEGGETPSNTPATGAPAIGGTPRVGETLTANTSGIEDDDGLDDATYRYQWTAGGSDIAGATGSSYALTSSEQGQTIQVRVTFTDDADNAESLTSAATVEVAAAPNRGATGAPTIDGTAQVGETLTASTSGITDEDGLTNATFEYQWIAGGSDIDGATGSSYLLTSSDQGQTIQVKVNFTDDADNAETLTSAATVEVAAAPAPLTASLPDSGFQSARHKGADDRPQVIVAFSLPVASFEKTTPSVSLTGATVSSVRRHEEDGLQNAWIFFLDPDGNDDIVFSLATGQPCDSGGICTEDGGMLSEGVQVTLPGPKEEGDDQQTPQSPPPAPTSLTATVNADGHIVLSWTAPDDDSITGYQVLRRRPGEGESALLVYVADTQSTATTFTDTGVAAGGKHVYRVKAINAAGLSGWSNYVNPTPEGRATAPCNANLAQMEARAGQRSARNGLSQVSGATGKRVLLAPCAADGFEIPSRLAPLPLLLIPWSVQAQTDPTDLTRPLVDGLIALEWDVSARNAASISRSARVGETPTTRIPEFADTHGLRHANFTCRWTPDGGAADAGIPDATGTTCSRSDEDDGTSINARVPFPDHRDRQETLAGGPVAYPMGPRQAPLDPQVEAGDPALSVTRPPPVAGDRAPVLRRRAQSYRVQSRKARGSCLETHSAYRSSAGLHSCDCAYDIPKSTTARCGRVDSR